MRIFQPFLITEANRVAARLLGRMVKTGGCSVRGGPDLRLAWSLEDRRRACFSAALMRCMSQQRIETAW